MRKPLLYTDCKVKDMMTSNQNIDVVGESRIGRVKKILSSPLTKKKSTGINDKTFGISLSELVHRNPECSVPHVVKSICLFIENNGLHHEGLFRVSGSCKAMERLRTSFDKTGDASLEEVADVMASACLLKQFLRDLPEPVIPSNLHNNFIAVHEEHNQNKEEYIRQQKRLVEQLPEENFNLLKYLISFLVKVVEAEEFNRMGPGALGIVFGPNLFRVAEGIDGLKEQAITNQIVAKFITEYTSIFEVDLPTEMVLSQSPDIVNSTAKRSSEKLIGSWTQIGNVSSDHSYEHDVINGILDIAVKERVDKFLYDQNESENSHLSCVNKKCTSESFMYNKDGSSKGVSNSVLTTSNSANISKDKGATPKKWSGDIVTRNEHGAGDGIHIENTGISEEIVPATPDMGKRDWGFRFDTEIDACEARRIERLQQFGQYQRNAPSKTRRSNYRNMRQAFSIDVIRPDMDEDSLKENEDAVHQRSQRNKHTLVHSSSLCENASSSCDNNSDTRGNGIGHEDCASPNTVRRSYVPPLDLTTLHQHADGSDPIPTNKLSSTWPLPNSHRDEDIILSPRSALLEMKNGFTDHNFPPSPPLKQDLLKNCLKEEDAHAASIKQHTKRIQTLKRKIKQFEDSFEDQHGYRPSHAEKMTRSDIKKCVIELAKVRKELKQLKEDARMSGMISLCPMNAARISATESLAETSWAVRASMEESLEDMLKQLAEKRQLCNRPDSLQDMDVNQILEEKVTIQKALLQFESVFGRPSSKLEKEMMKPIYDRYRCVKRLAVKNNSPKGKDAMELQPIFEHVTMDFTQASQKLSPKQSFDSDTEQVSPNVVLNENTKEKFSTSAVHEMPDVKKARKVQTSQLGSFNLHELSHLELLDQQWKVRGEKKRLRHLLKEFEDEFQRQSGRKVHKEDRTPMESIYEAYKQAKAKLKLLDALLSKHDHHYTV